MQIDDERESDNVEDRRGASGGGFALGGRGLGVGGIVIALVASYFFGVDPGVISLLPRRTHGSAGAHGFAPGAAAAGKRPKAVFVSRVLASTEDAWSAIFSEAGKQYTRPKLVLSPVRSHGAAARSGCRRPILLSRRCQCISTCALSTDARAFSCIRRFCAGVRDRT
jgi:predicted metalloprotease